MLKGTITSFAIVNGNLTTLLSYRGTSSVNSSFITPSIKSINSIYFKTLLNLGPTGSNIGFRRSGKVVNYY